MNKINFKFETDIDYKQKLFRGFKSEYLFGNTGLFNGFLYFSSLEAQQDKYEGLGTEKAFKKALEADQQMGTPLEYSMLTHIISSTLHKKADYISCWCMEEKNTLENRDFYDASVIIVSNVERLKNSIKYISVHTKENEIKCDDEEYHLILGKVDFSEKEVEYSQQNKPFIKSPSFQYEVEARIVCSLRPWEGGIVQDILDKLPQAIIAMVDLLSLIEEVWIVRDIPKDLEDKIYRKCNDLNIKIRKK